MMTPKRTLRIVLLLAAYGAFIFIIYLWVSNDPDASRETRVWKGHYTVGFEISAFRPCNSLTTMWAEGNLNAISTLLPQTSTLDTDSGTTEFYVEFWGQVGPSGTYGHLGDYSRQIDVKDTLRIEKEVPAGCF